MKKLLVALTLGLGLLVIAPGCKKNGKRPMKKSRMKKGKMKNGKRRMKKKRPMKKRAPKRGRKKIAPAPSQMMVEEELMDIQMNNY